MSQKDREREPFELELEIAAPVDAVWSALSEAAEYRRWFAPDTTVEPGPGGRIVWRWNELFEWPLRVEAWEPGRRVLARYDSGVGGADGRPRPLFVDFTLEARGDGATTLRLVHSGFGPGADFDEEYDGISRGWPVELRSLRHYLENHAGRDRRVTWSSAAVALSRAEAWARLTGPEGLACGPDVGRLAEGEPFVLAGATGDRFEGSALHGHPEELIARVASHGDGFLRLSADRCQGTTHVWLWLATYRPVDTDLDALRERWDGLLAALFPERVATPAPERAVEA